MVAFLAVEVFCVKYFLNSNLLNTNLSYQRLSAFANLCVFIASEACYVILLAILWITCPMYLPYALCIFLKIMCLLKTISSYYATILPNCASSCTALLYNNCSIYLLSFVIKVAPLCDTCLNL